MKPMLFLMTLAACLMAGCVIGPPPVYRVRVAPVPAPPPLTAEDLVRMFHAGISDDVMVEKIKSNGLTDRPTPDQLVSLKKEGLSDTVLGAMVNARVGTPPPSTGEYVYSSPDYYYPSYYGPWGYGPYGYGWGWPYWGWRYGCYPRYGYYYGGRGAVIIRH